ncbi:uncharacterized protein LOC110171191 isoform X2 [Boleophthalmus pectinirostris]|uniref:uncharacterized protein LOC110171191 isoform X2 n=1 Tax=Boleophthalmus pectinirostris TaxID=150288 RepID=UPI000A1C6FCE|nr:uncharacterized protein LOC110171191 isoform X2 [Boleophthalmus pectinirostris]
MKALCAVLCLGLLSVCRAAPLTCDQLLMVTQHHDLNFAGKWYVHAVSTDSCAISSFLNTFMKPSVVLDAVYKEAPNSYEVTTTLKTLSYCMNETESVSFDKTSVTTQNGNKYETYHLLHSSCSDCTVWKMDGLVKVLLLYSRKTTIDAADLKEFETQAACLNLPQPLQFNNDYDVSNCKDIEESPTDEETTILAQRLEKFLSELVECLVQYIRSWVMSSFS